MACADAAPRGDVLCPSNRPGVPPEGCPHTLPHLLNQPYTPPSRCITRSAGSAPVANTCERGQRGAPDHGWKPCADGAVLSRHITARPATLTAQRHARLFCSGPARLQRTYCCLWGRTFQAAFRLRDTCRRHNGRNRQQKVGERQQHSTSQQVRCCKAKRSLPAGQGLPPQVCRP